MNELLRSLTALPNFHPAAVHFPIVLLPMALLLDLAALLRGFRPGVGRAVAGMYVLGALSAWLAFWAGHEAVDGLPDLSPSVHGHISGHSDWALYTVWTFTALAAFRVIVAWREGDRPTGRWRFARTVLLLIGLLGLGLLFETADRGGALVYRHGVAVATAGAAYGQERPSAADPDSGQTSQPRLIRTDDGSLFWTPAPGDPAALGTVLTPAPGSSLHDVVSLPSSTRAEGLDLEVKNRVVLLLPGTFADVHVEVVIDRQQFSGQIGLAHHVQADGSSGLFVITTEGRARLLSSDNGAAKVLDSSTIELPSGENRLAVFAAGRHLKGLIAGKTVVHGHERPADPGHCGLLLDGRGVVRLLSMSVKPIEVDQNG